MKQNIPSDIEKKIDKVTLSLPFWELSLSNLLKNSLQSDSVLLEKGSALPIRIQPGDAALDFRQTKDRAGTVWTFDMSFRVVNRSKQDFEDLNFFTNKKVILYIGTPEFRYQVGYKDQLLDFNLRQTTDGFRVNVSGKVYYPAARSQVLSFRSSF